jgi:hypothetical protein
MTARKSVDPAGFLREQLEGGAAGLLLGERCAVALCSRSSAEPAAVCPPPACSVAAVRHVLLPYVCSRVAWERCASCVGTAGQIWTAWRIARLARDRRLAHSMTRICQP